MLNLYHYELKAIPYLFIHSLLRHVILLHIHVFEYIVGMVFDENTFSIHAATVLS